MDPRTYVVIEVVGVSAESYAEATTNAVERARPCVGWGGFRLLNCAA
jgi:flavin-binding protein dodecin